MITLDSITDAGPEARDQIAISGSHGGIYPAAVASAAGLRGVAFNDAGIGFQDAGIAGVMALDTVGMAAIAVDCQTCRIGDAHDMIRRGRISTVNHAAGSLGLGVGMMVEDAITPLEHAPPPKGMLPKITEARSSARLPGGAVVQLLDSASLVGPQDQDAIVVTGSHGALIGGDPLRALKAKARIAVFNDAGVGIENIGITRLPALDDRGVAAVTVSAASARIGDAASALETGVISHTNKLAAELGARVGAQLGAWLDTQG